MGVCGEAQWECVWRTSGGVCVEAQWECVWRPSGSVCGGPVSVWRPSVGGLGFGVGGCAKGIVRQGLCSRDCVTG